ncbi:MAG TPA: tannase/feruloyl esterase family alpha/beta hydrolase [Steroidobacteraceae bacterium]|nr:tannase/feruloyl esterase family alpha/beta hydrolase [Steroidobacteraceae bacterium]
MRTHHRAVLAGLALAAVQPAPAQDATIVNARIVVGDGPVIADGYILVQGGHIVTVAPGRPAQTIGTLIDATGLTAVPGFIDGHKHINTGPLEKQQMADLIDNGFTTVLSGGGPADGNLILAQHIDSGLINGPHVLASGRFNLHGTPEQAREAIRAMAAQGIKYTGEVAVTPIPTATREELAVLRAAVDEGAKDGVQVLVHAVSTPAMVAATQAGVRHEVHLPNKDFMSYDDAALIAGSGTHVLDTISFGAPIIDVFQSDDTPRFRTGLAWPESIAGANRDDKGRATGTEGAFALINARRIWDATGGKGLGYGSDQNYPVRDVLEHELKSLMLMFSMQDVIRILTINTASFLGLQNDIGTLEPLKRADIVLVRGNPLEDFHDLLRTVLVLKDGRVVVDQRTDRAAATDLGAAGAAPAGAASDDEPLVGTLSASVARPDQAPVVSCDHLGSVHLAQTRALSAKVVAAGSFDVPASPAGDRMGRTQQLPALCAVTAQLRAGRSPNFQLTVSLPVSGWNGSLLVLGDGPAVAPRELNEPLHRGYAVATMDAGPARARGKQARGGASDVTLHAGIEQAKTLVRNFYGATARYVYWIGAEPEQFGILQTHPEDFDGVVVSDANTTRSASGAAPDLTGFAARGGKIIEYRDGSGPAAASGTRIDAYESLIARSGGVTQAQRFYRLFILPTAHDGDRYRADWLTAIDEWVQRDAAPDVVLAAHLPAPDAPKHPPQGLVFEPQFGVHTVCAYPDVARLQNGAGETPVDWICLPGPRGSQTAAAQSP